ncbi:MAG: universal stress protein [Chloroflexi bacterium]|nr:universal stress protein [Chloroflexota bacterium]
MFDKVLVPLDGSELAEGILPFVSQLAKGLRIPVALLTVIDPDAIGMPERLAMKPGERHIEYLPSTVGSFEVGATAEPPRERMQGRPHEPGGPYATQFMDDVELETRRALNKVLVRLTEQGIEAEAVISFGRAPEQIVQVAEQVGAGLIAMSTHGRSALGRGVLGSVTDKVVHTAGIPTLTITPERASKIHPGAAISKIIVPLDGSELAESALPYVEDIARNLGLEILLIRVTKLVGFPYSDGYVYTDFSSIEEEIEKDAAAYMEGVAGRLRASGFKVEWKTLKGAPAIRIVEEAQAEPLGLIALTTHGRSGFRRWLLGSVAEAVVRSSGDPVLIIPPQRGAE